MTNMRKVKPAVLHYFPTRNFISRVCEVADLKDNFCSIYLRILSKLLSMPTIRAIIPKALGLQGTFSATQGVLRRALVKE
jgi:hypothetical protein